MDDVRVGERYEIVDKLGMNEYEDTIRQLQKQLREKVIKIEEGNEEVN